MKTFKQSLKNAKEYAKSIAKDKDKVSLVLSGISLTVISCIVVNEANKNSFKKRESEITDYMYDRGYGTGLQEGTEGTLQLMVNNELTTAEDASKAYKDVAMLVEDKFYDKEDVIVAWNDAAEL